MQRATSFRAGSAWKPTSAEKRSCACCGVMPSGSVMSTWVPRRTLSSTRRMSHLPCCFSCMHRSSISCECPFWSKSSIRRGKGWSASLTARWFARKSAHEGVQMGRRLFMASSPLAMRWHMSLSHGACLNCSHCSRVAGMAGAPCPLPIQVKVLLFICVSFRFILICLCPFRRLYSRQ